uniref:TLC domain-containing protein n=1 Tax=Lotharella oceanica TaxID=641309 RepID=A0A7S2U133_9EUKA|mmetsp:Transcript_5226/g.10345  ORF Transcript_5226/g.10345 Transcript_5226/m.10345 type:complete len:345 (+) Transcript_5226:335-1369(+)
MRRIPRSGAPSVIPPEEVNQLCLDLGYAGFHSKEHVAANVFVCFGATLVISILIHFLLGALKKSFKSLDIYRQRNCVTYVLELIYTTIVLALQIEYGWNVVLYGADVNTNERKGLSYAAVTLTTLYLFELIYRVRTHWQLMVHHFIAVGVLLVAFASWFDYPKHHAPIIRMCTVFVLHASTEQLCFFALLAHRMLDHDKHANFLVWAHWIAGASSYVIKTAICLVTWILWWPIFTYPTHTSYSWFWCWVFPVLNTIMLFVQWWASSIFITLSRRVKGERERPHGSGNPAIYKALLREPRSIFKGPVSTLSGNHKGGITQQSTVTSPCDSELDAQEAGGHYQKLT